jgi:hypothetical protein
VGGSVIIGGHKKKAQKVLLHLRRMYMPLQNYKDLELEFLENYWSQSKDILGVTHFGDLVPEVMHFGEDYEEILLELIETRIKYKLNKYRGNKPSEKIKEEILKKKDILKTRVEKEILSRLAAMRSYIRTPAHDPHISLEEIFRKRKNKMNSLVGPLRTYIQKRWGKIADSHH